MDTEYPISHTQYQINLPRALYSQIIADAREGWPEEVCGLVRGRDGRASALRRARNVAPNPVTDYEVDPADLLVQFDWEDEGDELIAIYHSHPADPAYPSASDAWNAHYPDAVYLICSLLDEAKPALNGFYLRPVPGEIDFAAARAGLDFYETRPGRWGFYLRPDAPLPPVLSTLARPSDLALYIVHEGGNTRAISVQPVACVIDR